MLNAIAKVFNLTVQGIVDRNKCCGIICKTVQGIADRNKCCGTIGKNIFSVISIYCIENRSRRFLNEKKKLEIGNGTFL